MFSDHNSRQSRTISRFLLLVGCFTASILLGGGLLLPVSAQNEERRIWGSVTDSATGEPLMGVALRIAEQKNLGAISDSKGKFRIQLPDNRPYTLEISCVGYERARRDIPAGTSGAVHIQLKESTQALQEMVFTGTRTPKLLKETPVVTRLISEEEIKSLDAPSVQDVLQTELPGLEFSYSMNQQVSLNLQGFGGNSVLFLVDGERLAGETLDNVDYSRLNMDNVSRIEIVKGAASSLYGSNAVGGVVNIISKEPSEKWSCNLKARYGSHNERQFGGSMGFNTTRFKQMFHLQQGSCDAIKLKNDGDYNTIYAYHTLHLKEKLSYTFRQHQTLTARAGYFFRERESQPDATERYRDFSGGMKGDFLIRKSHTLNISYTFDQYDKSDYSLLTHSDIRDYSNAQNSLRALYSHYFAKITLTVGGDYLHDYLMSYQFADEGFYRQHTADGFVQFDWNPTTRFNLISALRYDAYSEADVQHFSPKLGLMYKWNHFSLRGSYADGFRAPTLKEMYMHFNMANLFMIYGNPSLKAETSRNLNLTAEYTRNVYNVTMTGFYNWVENRITTAWNRALNGMQYINMATMQIAGIDCNASAKWDCGLQARFSYVFTHEFLKKEETNLSATRPHTATANISYGKKWDNYNFRLTLTGRYLSKVTCEEYTSMTSYEETETVSYPGYSIWKLTFNQTIWKGINITLSIDNLFNYVPDYYYNNSPATTGTTFAAGISADLEKLWKKRKPKDESTLKS